MGQTFYQLEKEVETLKQRVQLLETEKIQNIQNIRLECLILAAKSTDENPIKRAEDYINFVLDK